MTLSATIESDSEEHLAPGHVMLYSPCHVIRCNLVFLNVKGTYGIEMHAETIQNTWKQPVVPCLRVALL